MGLNDQFVTIGNEAVAWGTRAATLTRGIEQQPGNDPTHRVEHRASSGFRPGGVGVPTSNLVADARGGTYPIVADLLSKSHGLLLGGLGSVSISTPSGATLTRKITVTPSEHDLRSTTIHRAVSTLSGGLEENDYLGAVMTALSLTISPKANVVAKGDYDFKSVALDTASATPAYPSSAYVFRDTNVTTTLGGTDICQRGIDLTIPTGAKVDRDMVCPGGREQPVVVGRPQPTGTLSQDYVDASYIADWIAGTPRSLVFSIAGPEIEAGFSTGLTVTFPVVRFTGEDSKNSLDDLTVQPLPWAAYDNGTDPQWQLDYFTTDTTI